MQHDVVKRRTSPKYLQKDNTKLKEKLLPSVGILFLSAQQQLQLWGSKCDGGYWNGYSCGMIYISGCFECQLGAKVLAGRASWRNWFQTTTAQPAMQIRVQTSITPFQMNLKWTLLKHVWENIISVLDLPRLKKKIVKICLKKSIRAAHNFGNINLVKLPLEIGPLSPYIE